MVLGHIPLHPKSPFTVLSCAVQTWADRRLERLSRPCASLTLHDLLTGQMSLARSTFESVGGFDNAFTRDGSFGNEDIDFGYRLLSGGYRIEFNPQAISWQYYIVEPRQYLRQWRQTGGADVAFARKHPQQAKAIFLLNGAERRINRYVWRPILALPLLNRLLPRILSWLALTLLDHGGRGILCSNLFFTAQRVEYWRGVREAGGIPGCRTVRVLAYHAIADLQGAPVINSYAVPADVFRRQLDGLKRFGFRFLHPDEFSHFIKEHRGVPRRSVLLTFDDCYQDLLDVVLPILEQRRIPAIAFAISGQLGGTNAWDEARGAPRLQLLDAEGLQTLAQRGVEIGAHSRTHCLLPTSTTDELDTEVEGSVDDLEKIGLKRPRFFAYPYGEADRRVRQAARKANVQAAFTVKPGVVGFDSDCWELPRIEILKEDIGWKFLWKVAMGRGSRLKSGDRASTLKRLLQVRRVKSLGKKYSR